MSSIEAACPTCGIIRHFVGTRINAHTKQSENIWQCWKCAYEEQRMRLEKLEEQLVRMEQRISDSLLLA